MTGGKKNQTQFHLKKNGKENEQKHIRLNKQIP